MKGYYEYKVIHIDINSEEEMTEALMDALILADSTLPLGDSCGTFEVVAATLHCESAIIYTLRRKNR